MTDPLDWHEWLKVHPYPSLQDLLTKFDGYDKIPREVWIEYDYLCSTWNAQRIDRLVGSATWRTQELVDKP